MARQNRDSDEPASGKGCSEAPLVSRGGKHRHQRTSDKMDEEEVVFGQPDSVSVMKQRIAEQVVVNGVI